MYENISLGSGVVIEKYGLFSKSTKGTFGLVVGVGGSPDEKSSIS